MSGPDQPQRLRLARYAGYGAGDAANNLTFSMASAFLLIYYTNVAGIPPAEAGTLFLVVRILGGVTDLAAGRIADETTTRWGKFRPYVLFGSVPLLALLVVVFSIPHGLSPAWKLVWAYVSYALFQAAYSTVNIPYGSLAAAMTQQPSDRARLSTARLIFTAAAILVIAAVVSPELSHAANLQHSLTITVAIFAIIGVAIYAWCFAATRETVQRDAERFSIRATLHMLRHNRPLVILCSSSLALYTGVFGAQTVGIYYAKDVLGDTNLFIVITLAQTAGMIIAALAVPRAVGAVGKKVIYLAAGSLCVVAGAGIALSPASLPALGIASFGVLGLGTGAIIVVLYAMVADTVDYGEWNSGVRAEGLNYAIFSFTSKVGLGVGGAIAAYTISIGGYTAKAPTQTHAALQSIRLAAGGLPGALVLIATAVMVAYPLTERAFRALVADIAQRRAAAQLPGDATTPQPSPPAPAPQTRLPSR